MKCKECGHEGTFEEFEGLHTYEDNQIVYTDSRCPNCGNVESNP